MSGYGNTVLVVEDELLVRIDAVLQLEDLGFDVLSTGSADEALQILDKYPVHIVFTDINMPGQMNGLDLAKEVQSRWPDVAVVVTSGRLVNEAELPDGSMFMLKPYAVTDMIETVQEDAIASELAHELAIDFPSAVGQH